jgi:glycosyltransferase involved in cell wall biosynthesis
MDARPLISVILPVRNEAQTLPALLASLEQQDFPGHNFEVIVADGRSTDDTPDVVRRFVSQSQADVKLVDNPGIRSGPGRNAGLHAARGEFILFIDGHCRIPSPHLLRDTVFLFEETRADCLCRPQPLLAPVGSKFGAAVAAVRATTLGHGRDSLIYDMELSGFVDPASSGAAYRRSVFAVIGNYDEAFDACEDVELNTRVRKSGMKAYTDSRLAVFYQPRTTLASLLKQMVRYGRGRVRLIFKHPDCLSLGQIAPAILIAWITAAIVTAILPISVAAWLLWLLGTPALLYAAVVLLTSVSLARESGLRLLYRAPVIYCAIHFGLGIGIWAETFHYATNLIARRPPLKAVNPTEC